jgi:hypothetical protein
MTTQAYSQNQSSDISTRQPAEVNAAIVATLARIDALLFWRNLRLRFLPTGATDNAKLIRAYREGGI